MTSSKAMGALGMMSVRPLENPHTGTALLQEKVKKNNTFYSKLMFFVDNGVDLLSWGEKGKNLERECRERRAKKAKREEKEMDPIKGYFFNVWDILKIYYWIRSGKITVKYMKHINTSEGDSRQSTEKKVPGLILKM